MSGSGSPACRQRHCGCRERVAVEPEVAVEIADRAGLAEMFHAVRDGAVAGDGTEPRERCRMAIEHGDDRAVAGQRIEQPLEQPLKRVDDDFGQGAIDGAYWLRKPGPNCDVVIAYQGAVADEAIAAAG